MSHVHLGKFASIAEQKEYIRLKRLEKLEEFAENRRRQMELNAAIQLSKEFDSMDVSQEKRQLPQPSICVIDDPPLQCEPRRISITLSSDYDSDFAPIPESSSYDKSTLSRLNKQYESTSSSSSSSSPSSFSTNNLPIDSYAKPELLQSMLTDAWPLHEQHIQTALQSIIEKKCVPILCDIWRMSGDLEEEKGTGTELKFATDWYADIASMWDINALYADMVLKISAIFDHIKSFSRIRILFVRVEGSTMRSVRADCEAPLQHLFRLYCVVLMTEMDVIDGEKTFEPLIDEWGMAISTPQPTVANQLSMSPIAQPARPDGLKKRPRETVYYDEDYGLPLKSQSPPSQRKRSKK